MLVVICDVFSKCFFPKPNRHYLRFDLSAERRLNSLLWLAESQKCSFFKCGHFFDNDPCTHLMPTCRMLPAQLFQISAHAPSPSPVVRKQRTRRTQQNQMISQTRSVQRSEKVYDRWMVVSFLILFRNLTVSHLQVIKKAKEIDGYMRASGLNQKLEGGTLKLDVETRWLSHLHRFCSFFVDIKQHPEMGRLDKMKHTQETISLCERNLFVAEINEILVVTSKIS